MQLAAKTASFVRNIRRYLSHCLPFILAFSLLSVFTAPTAPAASVGSNPCVQTIGTDGAATVSVVGNDCIIKFTANSTWTLPSNLNLSSGFKYFVVGGGGGGGRGFCNFAYGAGGGGGAVETGTYTSNLSANQLFTISIGAGGAGQDVDCPGANDPAGNGNSSHIAASLTESVTARGGQGAQELQVATQESTRGGTSGNNFVGGVFAHDSTRNCTGTTNCSAGGGGGAGGIGIAKTGGPGLANENFTGVLSQFGGGGPGRGNNAPTIGASVYSSAGNSLPTVPTNTGAGGYDCLAPGGIGACAGSAGVVFIRYTSTYTVTYNYNGATADSATAASYFTTGGTAITLPTPTKTGYTFAGWYEDPSFGGSALASPYSPTQTRTINAKWATNTYTVTYNYNGATADSATATSSFTTGGTAITLPTPTKTGYTFANWYSDVGLTTLIGASGSPYSPSGATTAITAYAQWTGMTYTVTYNYNGATADSATATSSFTTGGTVITLPTPTKTGYTFAGWYEDSGFSGSALSSTYSPTQTRTINAKWTANTNNAITYNNYSATTAEVGGSTTYTTAVAIATIPTTAPLKTGYTFVGWFTASFGGAQVTDGSYTPPSPYGSITLHAQWTANTNNVITYNNYSATTAESGGSATYTTAAAIATIPTTAPLKTGYTFVGWFTASSGGVQVTNGSYTPPSPYGSITLHAQWTANTYTVTYNYNGATADSSTVSSSFTTGGSAITLPAPTKANFFFGGWYSDEGLTTFIGGASALYSPSGATTSLTAYARWNADYSIGFAGTQPTSARVVGAGGALLEIIPKDANFTVEAWIYPTGVSGSGATKYGTILDNADTGNNYGRTWLYVIDSGSGPYLSAGYYSNFPSTEQGTAKTSTANSIVLNSWQHVALRVTRSGGALGHCTNSGAVTIEIFINGISAGSNSDSSFNGCLNSLGFQIGDNEDLNQQFKGRIDQVKVWSGALSDTDIVKSMETVANSGITANALRAHYGFNDLASGPTSGNVVKNLASLTTDYDLSLYASTPANVATNISRIQNQFTITFDSNTATSGSVSSLTSLNPYSQVSLPSSGDLTKAGFTFSGWNTSANGLGTTYNPSATFSVLYASRTLYAKWDTNAYTVTYNYNGATADSATATTSFTTGGTSITLPTPIKTGYTFAGWYSDSGLTSSIGAAGASYSPSGATTSLTAYAKWDTNAYTLTYNYNGATADSSTATSSFTTGGTAITLPTPTKTGYTFAGWYSDSGLTSSIGAAGASYSPSGATTSLTAYAKWTGITYTVTYKAGTNGTGSDLTQTFVYGGSATLKNSSAAFIRVGYSITAWSTTDGGSSTNSLASTYSTSSNLTLYPVWTANTYTITFDAATNGGAALVPDTATYTVGTSAITLMSPSARSGYTESGWYTSASGGTKIGNAAAGYSPTSDITLYFQWVAINYTVTYNASTAGSGSVPVNGSNYNIGNNITVAGNPNSLARTGYTFAGWTDNSSGTGTVYTSGNAYTVASANVNFYAKWTANTYTVTYNANGGSGSPASATASYTTGSTEVTLSAVGTLAKTGYDFDGWSTSPTGSKIVGTYTTSADVTLYAVWNIKTITVTYDKGIASSATIASFPTSDSGIYNSTITLPTPTSQVSISGGTYQFSGWKLSGATATYEPGTSYLLPASNPTLQAQWIQVFEVTYIFNGGTSSTGFNYDAQCDAGTRLCTNNQSIQADAAPTRSGYDFTGWRDQSGNPIAAGATFSVGLSRYILYAQWAAIDYAITYQPEGGSSTPTQSAKQIFQSFTVANAITKNGYSFGGWSDGTLTYGAGASYTVGASVVTLTAQWIPNVYSINYDWNGGSGSTTPSDTFTVGNSAVVLPLVSSHVKDGYQFGGWALTTTGTTVGLSYTPTASVTLYAVWGPGTYTVSYNANGGSVGTSSASVTNGASATLPTPTRANYVFNGWYSASSGGTLAGASGATYVPAQSSTLYAQWIQASLYGISPSALTYIGTLNASNVIDVSFSGSNAGSKVSVNVPAGALPNGTDVNLHLVGDFSRAQGLISGSNSYIISIVVSWVAEDGTVPDTAADKPVSVVIANSTIKQGMSVYSIVGSIVDLLGTASTDGSITVALTTDPEVVVVATKPAAPTLVSASAGGDKQSLISWTAGSNGGSSVTGYTASTSTGESCTTISLSCSITGLSAATNYTFTVRASNAIGASDSSNSISARTADATTSGSSSSSSGTAGSSGSGSSGNQNVIVSPPITVVGSNKDDRGTSTTALPAIQGQVALSKLKVDKASDKFIADVKIVDSKIVLTPQKGFSGKKTVTVTVTTGGTEQVIQIPLIVLPEIVSKPVVEPSSATKTTIKWVASPNASSYKVFVNGKQICLSTTTSCVVKTVLGPNSVVEIVSNGSDRTTSEKIEATLVQKTPVIINRIFSANTKTGALNQRDMNALNKVANVMKSQGFTTVVISRIVTTSKTSRIATARVEAIKSYLQKKAGQVTLNFEVVPATTRTYFNNIALKS